MEIDQFREAIETIRYVFDLGTTVFVYLSITGARGPYNDINHYTMTLYTVDKQSKRKDLIKVEDYSQQYSMVAKKFQEIKDFLLAEPDGR